MMCEEIHTHTHACTQDARTHARTHARTYALHICSFYTESKQSKRRRKVASDDVPQYTTVHTDMLGTKPLMRYTGCYGNITTSEHTGYYIRMRSALQWLLVKAFLNYVISMLVQGVTQ